METERMATVVRAGEGRHFRFPVGNHGEVGASRDTGLGFGFLRTTLPPGTGMPFLHLHRRHDEAFQIVAGSIEYRLGEAYETAGPGDAVLVPAGVPHCFRAVGDSEASLLLIVSPADGIDVIEELARGNLLDSAWMAGVLERYDTELLETHPHWAPRRGGSSEAGSGDGRRFLSRCGAVVSGRGAWKGVRCGVLCRTAGLGVGTTSCVSYGPGRGRCEVLSRGAAPCVATTGLVSGRRFASGLGGGCRDAVRRLVVQV